MHSYEHNQKKIENRHSGLLGEQAVERTDTNVGSWIAFK